MALHARTVFQLLIGGLLLLQLLPAGAITLDAATQALELGPHYRYLEDRQRVLAIDEVIFASAARRFKPLDKGIAPNFGYTKSAYWLRVDIDNPLDRSRDWLVEIPFPTLDDVQVFLVDMSSGHILKQYATGDLQPFGQRPYPNRTFVFPLEFPAHSQLALIYRMYSEGSLTVGSRLLQPAYFHTANRNAYLALGLYFGLLGAVFAYNFLLYLRLRDQVYFYYIAYVGCMGVGFGAFSGIFSEFLWPDSPAWGNLATVIGFSMAGLFATIFSRSFLNSRELAPWLDKIMLLIAGLFSLMLLGTTATPYQLQAIFVSSAGMVLASVMVISAIVCLRRGLFSARFFLLAWSVLLIGAAALGARNLDWLPTNFFTLNAMQIGSALEMLLLSFALAERIVDLRRRKEAAENAAIEARQTVLHTLEKTEQELEDRVALRTRELQLLNDHLQSQKSQLKHLAMRDPLTGLANRLLCDERLVLALERARQDGVYMGLMVMDLDDFKPINDNYGHDVGDLLLKTVAERMKASVRTSDTVARLGGDEFVVILDGVKEANDMLWIGDKMVGEIAAPMVIGEYFLRITTSVGMAIFPHDGEDGETLLRRADQAMYEAKRSEFNRICLAPGLERLAGKAHAQVRSTSS